METNFLKKVFGNSAWMIASKAINMIIGFAISVCVTRYLGAEQKGAMADAQAIAGFFSFIASFGLLDILITKFSENENESAEIAVTAFIIQFVSGLVAFVLSIFTAKILDVSKNVLLYVAIDSSVYLFHCLSVYEYWFYSKSISKYYAITQSIIHILFLFLRFFGIVLKADLLYFVVATASETIIIYLSLLLCYKKAKVPFVGKLFFSTKVAKDIIKLALPMLAMGFATTIYMKVDQIMIGKMLGNAELGYYSVAVTLSEYWYFIPATIYSSFLPFLTNEINNNEIYKERLQKFTDLLVFISYLAVFAVLLFGRLSINTLYGNEFNVSADILIIYIWSGVFTCLSYSGQAYYITHKDTKTVMWLNIIGASLNFILNIILIYHLGNIGAALATLLEYIALAFGQMVVLRKKYRELYAIQLRAFFPFIRMWKYGKMLIKQSRVKQDNNDNLKK